LLLIDHLIRRGKPKKVNNSKLFLCSYIPVGGHDRKAAQALYWLLCGEAGRQIPLLGQVTVSGPCSLKLHKIKFTSSNKRSFFPDRI
jgi:hypothetical protein